MAQGPEFRIGILASGGGTTFEAVHEAIQTGELTDTEIAFVICNNGQSNPDASVWEKANRLGVDIFHVSNKTQENCTLPIVDGESVKGTISYEASERMAELAKQYDVNMLVALGFMRKVIGKVLEDFPIPNEHPGPLPATAGKHGTGVQEEIMKQGLAYSGPTMHWMDRNLDEHGLPGYDVGAIIGHQPVEVTSEMKAEWADSGTVDALKREVMRVEKLWVPKWIHLALEQL